MNSRPKNVAIATYVAIIGGLVAVAFLATALINIDPETSTFTQAAIAMLIAVLFFGLAGQLFPEGKGGYLGILAIGLINVVVIAVAIIVDTEANMNFCIPLFIIAVIAVLLILPNATEKWINYDRS